MAGHYDPAQPRGHHGEWTSGAEAVARNVTGKKPRAAKAAPDLSTSEARRAAVASADLSTPSGRSLVTRAQKAAQQSAMGSPSREEMTRRAQVMHGGSGVPQARVKGGARAARKKKGGS